MRHITELLKNLGHGHAYINGRIHAVDEDGNVTPINTVLRFARHVRRHGGKVVKEGGRVHGKQSHHRLDKKSRGVAVVTPSNDVVAANTRRI